MEKTKLRIHTWPEPILRKKCKEVKFVDDKIRALLDEMLSLMRVSGGAGLAANQAGLDAKLVVIEIDNKVIKLINPCIKTKEGKICFKEGCLSFPGLELDIERANRVKVEALNEKGEKVEFDTEGILAVVFQHEIDHVTGKVFIDRISFSQRLKSHFKLRKIIKRTKDALRQ